MVVRAQLLHRPVLVTVTRYEECSLREETLRDEAREGEGDREESAPKPWSLSPARSETGGKASRAWPHQSDLTSEVMLSPSVTRRTKRLGKDGSEAEVSSRESMDLSLPLPPSASI